MSLERRIEFTAAWDRRDPNSSKNYGVHGVEMRWYLVGEEGAVQFVVFTNWMLPHIREERKGRDLAPCLYEPMGADLGYHSRVPRYEGQEPMSKCHLLNCPCYYDGSGLNADRVLEILIREGSDAAWKEMETYYASVFHGGDA